MAGKAPRPVEQKAPEPIRPPVPIPAAQASGGNSAPGEGAPSYATQQAAADEETKSKQGSLGTAVTGRATRARRAQRDPAAATSQTGGTMGSAAVITG